MTVLNRDYHIEFVRGRLLADLGFEPSNLEGISVFKVLDSDGGEIMRQVLSDAFAEKQSQALLPYGRFFLRLSAVPIDRDVNGTVTKVLLVSNDITDVLSAKRTLEVANREKAKIITREKAARLEANRQRDLFTRLFESAPAMMALVRGSGLICEVANRVSFTGDAQQNFVGKSFYEILPGLQGSPAEEMLRETFERGEGQHATELELTYPGGRGPAAPKGYFNVATIPMRNPDGEVDGVVFFATDVTEVVCAKRVLEQAAERLREMVNSLPVIAWTEDPAGRVDYYNRRWYAFAGGEAEASAEELPQVAEFILPDDVLRTRTPHPVARQARTRVAPPAPHADRL